MSLPPEFETLFALMKSDYERKRSLSDAAPTASRPNLLAAVQDNYLSTGTSLRSVFDAEAIRLHRKDSADDEEVIAPKVARKLNL